jgi:hypothetical protein
VGTNAQPAESAPLIGQAALRIPDVLIGTAENLDVGSDLRAVSEIHVAKNAVGAYSNPGAHGCLRVGEVRTDCNVAIQLTSFQRQVIERDAEIAAGEARYVRQGLREEYKPAVETAEDGKKSGGKHQQDSGGSRYFLDHPLHDSRRHFRYRPQL